MWKCLYLPWHKLRINKVYETGGEQIGCSCGKLYAMSSRARSFLHWSGEFEAFYKDIKVIKDYTNKRKN